MSMKKSYTASLITDKNGNRDICIESDGKTKHIWGRYGSRREQELAEKHSPQTIPVLIGSGLGEGLGRLLETSETPVIVVDREEAIIKASGTKARYDDNPRVIWLEAESAQEVVAAIDRTSKKHGLPVEILRIPFYLRLDPDFYSEVEKLLSGNIPEQKPVTSWPKFRTEKPRILLMTSQYFLMGEIEAACSRLNIPHRLLNIDSKESDLDSFVNRVIGTISTFKPDFVLTVNHLGVDQEGYLNTILHKFGLPLASWFVDNPHLILPLYSRQADENTALFTWDADRMESLAEMGFSKIFHLPLGTDQSRFKPVDGCHRPEWKSDISFVGNSMVHKTAKRLEATGVTGALAQRWNEIATEFGRFSEPSVRNFLKQNYPELYEQFQSMASPVRKLAFETSVIWQSTLEYRLSCVKKTLPFSPLIVGDDGWQSLLPPQGWKYHGELSYYDDLPRFYPCSKISFNCTSQQMKGAVNQRVFDVPACNGFLLTDHRQQISELFEPEKEIVFYRDIEEIPSLVEKYLHDREARLKVVKAARKRILADHTYDRRMERLTEIMRATFS